MNKSETTNFIFKSEINLEYFEDVLNFIRNNEKRILNFFDLEKLKNRYTIRIMKYESFKEFIINKYGSIKEYVRGDTDFNSKIISILDIEDQKKYTTHKDSTLEETLKMILHEIVHACHDEVNNSYYKNIWFSEGLATNLSNQNYSMVDLNNCDFKLLKSDFRSYGKGNYSFAYTIVKYVLDSFSREEILKLVYDSNYLESKSNEIYEKAKMGGSKNEL